MTTRIKPKDIPKEWVRQAIEDIESGKSYEKVLFNIPTVNFTIIPKISHKFFKKVCDYHQLEFNTKPGRKTIPIDTAAEDAYLNLTKFAGPMSINKMTKRIRSDIVTANQHPEKFQEMQRSIDINDEDAVIQLFNSGPNWFDSIDRGTSIEQLPKVSGPPIDIMDPTNQLKSALYLNIETPVPSYRMGRKIFEKHFKEPEVIQYEEEQNEHITTFQASYCFEVLHADIHYFHKTQGDYIYAIIDDRSRLILDAQFMDHKTAQNTWETAKRGMDAFNITPYAFWVDNGLENKGEFLRECNAHGINVINTDPYTPRQNGKIEKWWIGLERHVKTRRSINQWKTNYNSTPHESLPINPLTGVNFTPLQFCQYEKDNWWSSDKEPTWIVDGEVKNLGESILKKHNMQN